MTRKYARPHEYRVACQACRAIFEMHTRCREYNDPAAQLLAGEVVRWAAGLPPRPGIVDHLLTEPLTEPLTVR